MQIEVIEFRPGHRQKGQMTLNDTSSLLAFLKSRKSASAKAMGGQGPTAQQLHEILEIATRVPDHGKLAPWRFVIFEGEARAKVGELFAKRWAALNPTYPAEVLAFHASLFMRAPLVVAVVSTAAPHVKIPVWEQQMSAASVCFNFELGAQALGFDVQWQTDWVAYDDGAKAAMGLTPNEQIAGFIYVGKSTVPLEDRPRPDVATLVTHWST